MLLLLFDLPYLILLFLFVLGGCCSVQTCLQVAAALVANGYAGVQHGLQLLLLSVSQVARRTVGRRWRTATKQVVEIHSQ